MDSTINDIVSYPWGAILTFIILIWAVVSLALLEWLRKSFPSGKDFARLEKEIEAWTSKAVTRGEVDGLGKRVNDHIENLASTKEVSFGNRADIKVLQDKLSSIDSQSRIIMDKADRLSNDISEVKAILSIMRDK